MLKPLGTRSQLSVQHTTSSKVHLHTITIENTRSAIHPVYYFEQGPLTRYNHREYVVSHLSSILLRARSTYIL